MKKIMNGLVVLFVFALMVCSVIASGAGGGGGSGSAAAHSLVLENKIEGTWEVIDDSTFATVTFNDIGPTFDFTLDAEGLEHLTSYSLIYYADPWAGNNPGALLGEFTSNGDGEINAFGSVDLGFDLPHPDDENGWDTSTYCTNGFNPDATQCQGAKIWLVPSVDYNAEEKKLIAWHSSEYLFETDLITYTEDDDAPVIAGIQHTPENPTTSDDVVICASVTDASGVEEVRLSVKVNGEIYPLSEAMINTEGDTYCKTLSADSFNEGEEDGLTIFYHIKAEDIHGEDDWEPTGFELSFTYDGADPVADAGGPYECDEGTTILLNGSGSTDTVDDELDFAWDLNGIDEDEDGDFYDDDFVVNPEFTCVDDSVNTVSLKVTDNVGNEDTADATVTVNNVAPVVTVPESTSGEENMPFTLGDVQFDDVEADTHTATVDWGDGTPVEELGTVTNPISGLTHTFTVLDEVYTITITVTDDDNGVGSDTLTVTVGNAVPVVTASVDTSGEEGSEITIGETLFTDASCEDDCEPAVDCEEVCEVCEEQPCEDPVCEEVCMLDEETHTATIDWGDGTPVEDLGEVTSPIAAQSHTYEDNGVYEVTITVTDSNGDSGLDNLEIDVSNALPVVEAGEDQIVLEADTVTVNPTFTDAGVLDSHTAVIDWGDDSIEDLGEVTSPIAAQSHEYENDGVYTVTVTVTDNDGGESSDTLTVTVHDYEIELGAGWNLISLPLVPKNDVIAIESVLSGISENVESVWSYQQGEWLYFRGVEGDTLTTIIPGFGYYIKMENDDTLYLSGEKMYNFEENAQPPSVLLTPGWNLIGHYGMNEVIRDDALTTLAGNYASFFSGDGTPVSELNPTHGYWLVLTGTNGIEYAPSNEDYEEN